MTYFFLSFMICNKTKYLAQGCHILTIIVLRTFLHLSVKMLLSSFKVNFLVLFLKQVIWIISQNFVNDFLILNLPFNRFWSLRFLPFAWLQMIFLQTYWNKQRFNYLKFLKAFNNLNLKSILKQNSGTPDILTNIVSHAIHILIAIPNLWKLA